jgi:hypothetical protein
VRPDNTFKPNPLGGSAPGNSGGSDVDPRMTGALADTGAMLLIHPAASPGSRAAPDNSFRRKLFRGAAEGSRWAAKAVTFRRRGRPWRYVHFKAGEFSEQCAVSVR